MSKEQPAIGDVWAYRGELHTLTRRHEGHVPGWRFGEGGNDWFMDVSFASADSGLTFVRGPEPAKVEPVKCAHGRPHYCGLCGGPVTHDGQGADKFPEHQSWPAKADWAKWLPPGPLPDTGPKEFKVGQVWAVFSPVDKATRNVGAAIVRVEKLSDTMRSWCAVKALAGDRIISGMGCNLDGGAERGLHAVLIQDVGEPHPRPVEQVYGAGKVCDAAKGAEGHGQSAQAVGAPLPTPPVFRPAPLGMSEADVALEVRAAWEGKANGIRGEAPKGTSEAELEALANPWKRRRA